MSKRAFTITYTASSTQDLANHLRELSRQELEKLQSLDIKSAEYRALMAAADAYQQASNIVAATTFVPDDGRDIYGNEK
jgi:hypothetical protein